MPAIDFENLFEQANRLRDSARVNEAISVYQDIAGLATENHELFFKARALHLAGVSAREAVKDKNSSYCRDAFTYYRQAEEIYRFLKDSQKLGALYRDMGITADYAADYANAPIYFQKALALLQDAEAFGELAITYDKLGLHFLKLGQLEEAKKFINQALDLLRREPTAGFFRATTLLDLSRVHFKLKQFDRALELAEESLGWYSADHPGKEYTRRLAQLNGLISLIHTELDNQKQAQKYFFKYQALLKTFDPLAAEVLIRDWHELAS